MEKERKRLARDAEEKAVAGPAAKRAGAGEGLPERRKELRARPERKGRKPFIPPSGRNAGLPLGGNLAGRRRLERERQGGEEDSTMRGGGGGERPGHPLGRDAGTDD
jgi:hypothetical protein